MGSTRHGIWTVLLLAVITAAVVARAGASPQVFQPTFEPVPCPADVTALTEGGSVLSCGYLTVLEDRTDPAEGTIRLFVVTASPESGPTLPDPIFIPGRDLVGRSPSSIPF